MEKKQLKTLLGQLYTNQIDVETVLELLNDLPFHDIECARIDHHRGLRTGHPEVIFCQGKTAEQVVSIAREQIAHDETVFGTRAPEETLSAVKEQLPGVEIDLSAHCFWKKSSWWEKKKQTRGTILIVSAGTADNPVAREAQLTVNIFGHPSQTIQDVGVSGIHRLLACRKQLQTASAIIVIAGMEGALPSVVTGLVSCPVIGVPTSVGYGAHLNGLVPLFAMVNSCASGLTVVNIDNGFGAACAAVRINAERD
ncbi:MAG: nickel pincer cofactor biosynthesis protein LarB [Chitinivibrionales bacterium]